MRTEKRLTMIALVAIGTLAAGIFAAGCTWPEAEVKPKGCEYKGATYAAGESFKDDCNTCFCNDDGTVACTKIGCVATCEYDGTLYKDGDQFKSTDGCNSCSCKSGGVICTKMACVKTCTSTDDCPEGQWCGYGEKRVCKPYAALGESCGGFMMPEYVQICAPEHTCVNLNPMVMDLPGRCATKCDSDAQCGKNEYCTGTNGGCRAYVSEGEQCGGINAEKCAPGLSCNAEDTWSTGTCEKAPSCTYDESYLSYVSKDPEKCKVIKYACQSGEGFSNSCGCGCKVCPEWINCMPSIGAARPNCSGEALAKLKSYCPNTQVAY